MNNTSTKEYHNYQREVFRVSRCLDESAELRVCDKCACDYYGRPGQNLCKDCHDKEENEV